MAFSTVSVAPTSWTYCRKKTRNPWSGSSSIGFKSGESSSRYSNLTPASGPGTHCIPELRYWTRSLFEKLIIWCRLQSIVPLFQTIVSMLNHQLSSPLVSFHSLPIHQRLLLKRSLPSIGDYAVPVIYCFILCSLSLSAVTILIKMGVTCQSRHLWWFAVENGLDIKIVPTTKLNTKIRGLRSTSIDLYFFQ